MPSWSHQIHSMTLKPWIFGLAVDVEAWPGTPWFSALGIIVMNLSFVPSHNAIQKSLPSLPFQAAVHKQTNAVQHLLVSIRTAPNFLASESFSWLWGVLKWLVESLPMIVPILFDFDTSLVQVMPPILHLRKPSFFHRYAGLRCQNYRSWSVETAIRSFTNSGLIISIWEHSMSLSRRFLHIVAKN